MRIDKKGIVSLKPFRLPLFALEILIVCTGLSWVYTSDRNVKILYSGTNSFDGSKPYVWYVIAEVHASARADGSSLSEDGCDAPGSFFLETKEGWVHVPEGAFPEYIGFWMGVFDLSGPGQSEPSTPRAPGQPEHFCGTTWYR